MAFHGVEQSCGARTGVLGGEVSSEVERKGIGNIEENAVFELSGVLHLVSVELIDGVELHLLDSGESVNFAVAHDAANSLLRLFGALITVVVGLAHDAAVTVEEHIIDSPGVDGDTVEVSGGFESLAESGNELIAESIIVPV